MRSEEGEVSSYHGGSSLNGVACESGTMDGNVMWKGFELLACGVNGELALLGDLR